MRYLLLLLLSLSLFNCENNPMMSTDEVASIEIIANLSQDANGYYHMQVVRSNQQTLHRISLQTNFDASTRIEWDANSSWIGIHMGFDFEVPVINSVSYTSPDDGTAQTMFAPVVELVGDTVTVFVSSGDATDQIEIILE